MKRNTLTEEDAMRKITSQMPVNIKVKKADIVVENGNTLEELEKQVTERVIPKVF